MPPIPGPSPLSPVYTTARPTNNGLMLRELIDPGMLEDFVTGLGATTGLRVAAYDPQRRLIVAGPPRSRLARLRECLPRELPSRLTSLRLPADEPPASVEWYEADGVGYVVAPAFADQVVAGFVAVGELRPISPRISPPQRDAAEAAAYEALPLFEGAAEARPIRLVRWSARVLSDWVRRELRNVSVSEQLALMGDIATLLTGEGDLQWMLDRLVTQTARVMRCPFCSLRLYNEDTGELELTAGHNLSERYLHKGVIHRQDNPIDDAALRGEMVYVPDATSDARFQFPDEARREGIVSVLTTGLIYRGRPVGVMRVYTDRPQRFRAGQRELLRAVAAQTAIAIVNARLLEERLRAADTERQVAIAAQVQTRMLDFPPPEHPAVQAARLHSPSSAVSGDFTDFVRLCDGRLAVVVADVVGKGIPAALLGASLRGALRAGAEACLSIDALFDRLNRHMCRETTTREFATLVMLAFGFDGLTAEYASAGHEPPLLLREGEVIPLPEGNLVFGIEPRERYQAHPVTLRENDLLLLYTDGATDATDFRGERFGIDRLRKSLRDFGEWPPEIVLRNIMWDIRRFVGLAEQVDDITLLGVRVRPRR